MFSYIHDPSPMEMNKQIAVVHPAWNELPKSHYGYATNNVYPGFPPIMADSRSLIASWQPESVVNDRLIKENGIQSNWDYRRFMTQNAQKIMKRDFIEAANDVGYYERLGADTKSEFEPMPPPLHIREYGHPAFYTSYLEKEQPYGVTNSDLKTSYLSREQLQSQMTSPVLTQDELLKIKSQGKK